MVIKFYNREEELAFLRTAFKKVSIKSIMVVVYGRRRVGKTELLTKFCEGKKYLYIFIEPKPDKEILEELETSIEELIGVKPRFDTWDEFFEFIFKKLDGYTVIFDEFQNFIKVNPGIFSKIQKYWDKYQHESKIFLVLIGSYVGLMKKIFMESKQPLFGRADFLFNLNPFNFFQSAGFIRRNFEESFYIYAVFGGIPKYLLYSILYSDTEPLSLIDMLFIREPAPLREEGKNILVLEFGSEHQGYFSVLEAIANGRTTQKEIVDYTGLSKDAVGKYLYELVNIYGIVERDYPVTEKKRSPRLSRYFLRDNFYRFWFRFIYRNLSLLESNPEKLRKMIFEQINAFCGLAFEDVAKEFLIALNKNSSLPFAFDRIGKWWSQEEEIDIVALSKETKKIAFFEAKWSELSRKDAEQLLAELKRKAALVSWYNRRRKERYGIIAKKIEGKEELKARGFIAYDLRDFRFYQTDFAR